MNNKWYKGIGQGNNQLKNDRKKLLLECEPALVLLKQILQDELAIVHKTACDNKEFENISWPYKQAYLQGEASRLIRIINLLDLNKAGEINE